MLDEQLKAEIAEGEEYSVQIMDGDGEVLTEYSKEAQADTTVGDVLKFVFGRSED